MRAVGRALLVDRRTQRLGERGGRLQRIALHDLVAGDDDRPLGLQHALGERIEHGIARARARIDPGRGAEVDAGLGIEDVARQRDEHRPRRRRHGDLGGAAHDARQILQPRHLHGPLHQRLRHRHQRVIQQRLGEPVALLLLAGGEDHRRAGELGVEQRAHGIAEPRRHVHVAGDQLAAGAREAVGHRHHQRLLQAQHVGEVGVLGQRMHDRQLGGARVAEQVRDALVLEQREERGAAGDAVHAWGSVICGGGQGGHHGQHSRLVANTAFPDASRHPSSRPQRSRSRRERAEPGFARGTRGGRSRIASAEAPASEMTGGGGFLSSGD